MRSPGPTRHRVMTSTTTSVTGDVAGRTTMGAGWSVPSYLLTGAGLFGGLGWLVDGWLGTSFLVAVGVVVGLGLALYVIWIRYVSPPAGGSQGRPSGRGPMSRHGGGDPEEAL